MSADELFTRCPTCRTVFRTNDDQLSVQAGKVRCGQCRMVFDGRAHLTDLSPKREEAPDEMEAGPPTVMLRSSEHLCAADEVGPDLERHAAADKPDHDDEAAAADERRPDSNTAVRSKDAGTALTDVPAADAAPEGTFERDRPERNEVGDPQVEDGDAATAAHAPTSERSDPEPNESGIPDEQASLAEIDAARIAANTAADSDALAAAAAPDDVVMPSWEETPPPPRRGVRWAYGIAAALLLATLVGQVIYHFRHVLAAEYPRLRPQLSAVCAALGCAIDPLRNKDEITIESHDLQADPAHQGLLILQTTLRNQARHAIAFPHLELELNDLAGQPIVRRVFAPVEYAGGAANFAIGLPASAEWSVKIFLDASTVTAGGYNLYLFYP